METIVNKDIIQPALITRAKYNFSVIEKRILYRILIIMQRYLEGGKLDKGFKLDVNIFNDWDIVLPTRAFLKNEEDKNYKLVRDNLLSLQSKIIELKTENEWAAYNIIERAKIKDIKGISSNEAFVSFRLAPQIVDGLFNYAKGFTRYELKVAFELESEYSMRFYEMVSEQKTKPFLDYKIETLKEYFGIEKKYIDKRTGKTNVAILVRRVIEPAKKELDSCSPWTFEYSFLDANKDYIKPNNRRTRKTYIRVVPKYQSKFRDENLEKKKLLKKVSIRHDLDKNVLNYLKQTYNFNDKEIKNNQELFVFAYKKIDLLNFLALKQREAGEAKNPKGYIIKCIKNQVKKTS